MHSALPDPPDAQLEAYQEQRAGRPLTPREADGKAADDAWANAHQAVRNAKARIKAEGQR